MKESKERFEIKDKISDKMTAVKHSLIKSYEKSAFKNSFEFLSHSFWKDGKVTLLPSLCSLTIEKPALNMINFAVVHLTYYVLNFEEISDILLKNSLKRIKMIEKILNPDKQIKRSDLDKSHVI